MPLAPPTDVAPVAISKSTPVTLGAILVMGTIIGGLFLTVRQEVLGLRQEVQEDIRRGDDQIQLSLRDGARRDEGLSTQMSTVSGDLKVQAESLRQLREDHKELRRDFQSYREATSKGGPQKDK